MKYVAFLRGINSGRNPTTKMEVLRLVFEELGFSNVRTVIASGNVIFESSEKNAKKLAQKIEKALPAKIGFHSETIVYSIEVLQKLIAKNPFQNISLTKDKNFYVTFVKNDKTNLKFPVNGKGYEMLSLEGGVVASVIDLAKSKSPDLMKVLDKEFGKGNTTRNWSTIKRIENLL